MTSTGLITISNLTADTEIVGISLSDGNNSYNMLEVGYFTADASEYNAETMEGTWKAQLQSAWSAFDGKEVTVTVTFEDESTATGTATIGSL